MITQNLTFGLALLLAALPFQSRADDIDYEGPQARYEDQARIADRAEREYNSQAALLRSYESNLSDAQNRLGAANRALDNAENRIDSIDRSIDQKERAITDNDSENSGYQRQISSIKNDIRSLESRLSSARQSADRYRRDYEDLDSKIRQLEASDPNNTSLPGLRSQRSNAQSQLNNAENDIRNLDAQIRSKENDVDSYQSRIDNNNRETANYRQDIRNLERDRDSARSDLDDAKEDARRAQSDISTASRDIERQKVTVSNALRDFQEEDDLKDRLYAEYQRVLDNYNREVARVLGIAEQAAIAHSNREADEKAGPLGQSEGAAAGQTDGSQKAEVDKRGREIATGYVFGRANPQSTDELKAAYGTGFSSGQAVANRKAAAEDLPKGYNQSLSQLLGSSPSQVATIDVTNQLPTDPGSNGTELSTNLKPIGNVTPPSVTPPSSPTISAPVFTSVSPVIPAHQNQYANPPCANQRRADIETKCRQKYADTYTSQFATRYKTVYVSGYGSEYTATAKRVYDASVAIEDAVALQKGKEMGAGDAGLLDGFSQSLPAARAQKFAEGQAQFDQILAQSYLVNFKSIEIEDTNQNGIIEPSEKARIKMTFDNLGKLSTPLGNLQVKIISSKGVETVVFQTRDIPSLAAETRTTLVGITSIVPAGIEAGSKLEIAGNVYSKDSSGTLQPVASFTQSATVNYPLEIADINLPGSLTVNQKTPVKVTFKNMTNQPIVDAKSVLSSVPAFLDIKPAELKVLNLQPGATQVSDTDITAGPWVTEGIPVAIQSASTVDGKTITPQPFMKSFGVIRNAAVKIMDASGRPLRSNTIEARAGSTVHLYVQLDYKASSSRSGPFVVAKTQTSTPQITTSNNSTISVDYGSMSPGTTVQPIDFSYDTSTSLRGKTEWVMFGVREGNTWLHTPQIFIKFN